MLKLKTKEYQINRQNNLLNTYKVPVSPHREYNKICFWILLC